MRASVAVVALLVLRAPAALASGLGIPDLGAAALGRGAAGVAAPADPSALYYNPAGLASQDGLGVLLDLRVVSHRLLFQRLNSQGANPENWPVVENTGAPALGPLFAATWRALRSDKHPVTIALGGYPATGYSGYEFPDPAAIRAGLGDDRCSSCNTEAGRLTPQRYTLVASNPLSYTFSLGAGVRATPWLDVGATLQNQLVRFRTRQSISANSGSPGESVGWDAVLAIDAADWMVLLGTLGASARLPGGLSVGASLQLPADVNAKGTMTAQLGSVLQTAQLVGQDIDLELHLPWIARLGVRFSRPLFDLELAGTYDAWSRYRTLKLVPKDMYFQKGEGRLPLGTFELQKGMQDAQSVRLGAELRPGLLLEKLSFLVLRCGVVAETSAVPEERTALDQAHWERISLNAGAGVRLGRYDLSLGYAHYFQPDRNVRTSAVRQSAPLLPSDQASTVGNGDYRSIIDILAVSVAGRFDL